MLYTLLDGDGDRLRESSACIVDFQRDGTWLAGGLDDDHELSVEQTHRGLGERLERGGVAVADSAERSGSLNIERQLVGSIGNKNIISILPKRQQRYSNNCNE